MKDLHDIQNWLCDMDGVLINNDAMIQGADRFLARLRATNRSFMVLTNNSLFTPREIRTQLSALGLEVEEGQVWTSALASAQFVHSQRPRGTAFIIGRESIHEALADVGYREDATNPDYVVLGETQNYSFDDFATAIQLIEGGSHFVTTNPEPTGPSRRGSLPGCGAMSAMIERATGVSPYTVGKPNSRMIREAMDVLGASTHSTVMIGDRMKTDVLAGVDSGLETILVLSGADGEYDASRYPYRPSRVVASVAELIDEL
ncbi:MAG TPA: HAD-IIA family hydrolase [Acidimicrobiales bacterium]